MSGIYRAICAMGMLMAFTLSVQAGFIGLTDSFGVEVFSEGGALTASRTLTGSGAATGADLIDVAYGDFLSSNGGNELMVLRTGGIVEFYADPLVGSGSLSRLNYKALDNGGRVILSIHQNGANLMAYAASTTFYGYEYQDGVYGANTNTLARITSVTTRMNMTSHTSTVSMVAADNIDAAAGLDWALLADDGFIQVFSDPTASGTASRQTYLNATFASGGVNLTSMGMRGNQLIALDTANQLNFFDFDGDAITYHAGSDINLQTSSTLTGFVPTVIPEPATIGLFVISGAVIFMMRRLK